MSFQIVMKTMICALVALSLSGCGGTQVAPANRKLLAALQTAVSAKKLDWLTTVARQLTDKKSAGEVSDAEYKVLNSIVTKAQAGDWKAAQKEAFALSESQHPTTEDLQNVRDRKSIK